MNVTPLGVLLALNHAGKNEFDGWLQDGPHADKNVLDVCERGGDVGVSNERFSVSYKMDGRSVAPTGMFVFYEIFHRFKKRWVVFAEFEASFRPGVTNESIAERMLEILRSEA